LTDKRQHPCTVDVWTCRGADCDTDHYLMDAHGILTESEIPTELFGLIKMCLNKIY
jgi:hypothetical protein